MTLDIKKPAAAATPLVAIDRAGLPALAATWPEATRRWIAATGFDASPDTHLLLPGADGRVERVLAGVREAAHPYALAALPKALPPGRYRLAEEGLALDPAAAALSWTLGSYTFDAYRKPRRDTATLALPPSEGATRGALQAAAITATRDLVNTPAEHLGPAELAETVRALAKAHGARFKQTVGDKLLAAGFPAIHAVGRAAGAGREPRLIELDWGNPRHPLLTLVGKGVCFDSGGLDIKPAEGMRLMKKDMGGAANAIGLAMLIMALKLPVRLQLLIPAVENAIAGNAYRPGDVIRTRAGLHVEIGNTDAEGRVILCDALAYGVESQPQTVIDLATLTGAARVALGPQLPALFCRDMATARALVDRGLELHDPLWHMPLWPGYHGGIESDIADIVNTGKGPMAGAISAALFLADFVPESVEWLHIDLFAWNSESRPGRPAGGEAQTIRTLLDWIERRAAA